MVIASFPERIPHGDGDGTCETTDLRCGELLDG